MPYHGLDHEPLQPEQMIRTLRYLASPALVMFKADVDRDAAKVIDQPDAGRRVVVLNPVWRDDVEEAGIEFLPPSTPRDRAIAAEGLSATLSGSGARLRTALGDLRVSIGLAILGARS